MATSKLIGKQVKITSRGHTDEGNWGVVTSFDGENYHVAMNENMNAQLVFDRDEFVVSRKQPAA